jgi:ABC-type multidrug transport system fused ATPase/permease subunit
MSSNRTTLAIVHRLATIRGADRIVVLTDEEIAEEGSHVELMGEAGLYARLYTA